MPPPLRTSSVTSEISRKPGGAAHGIPAAPLTCKRELNLGLRVRESAVALHSREAAARDHSERGPAAWRM